MGDSMKKALILMILLLAVSAYGACEQEKAQYDQALAAYNSEKSVQNQQMMSASYQRYIECVGSMPATTNQAGEPGQQYKTGPSSGADANVEATTTQEEPEQKQETKQKTTETSTDSLDYGDIRVVSAEEEADDTPIEEDFQVKLAVKLTRMLENEERSGTIVDPNGEVLDIVYEDGAYYLEKDGEKVKPADYMAHLKDQETNYGTGLRTQTRQQELRRPEDSGYVTRDREYKPMAGKTENKVKERLMRIQDKGNTDDKEMAERLMRKLQEIPTERMKTADFDEIMEVDLPDLKKRIEQKTESLRDKDENILEGAGMFKRFVVWVSGKIPIVGGTASKVYDKSLEVGIETGKFFAKQNSARDQLWEEEFGY